MPQSRGPLPATALPGLARMQARVGHSVALIVPLPEALPPTTLVQRLCWHACNDELT